MKNNIKKDEYINYMIDLKNSVFKILPMYEEEVKTLDAYIKNLRIEVYEVRELSHEYDGVWMVKLQAWLRRLRRECSKVENKSVIRSIVLGQLTSIDKQIELIKGAE